MSYKTGLTAAETGAASRENEADLNQADCDRIAFRGYDDAVRRWIPTMNLCMLGETIFDLSEAWGFVGDVGPQIARSVTFWLIPGRLRPFWVTHGHRR
jgi:hypothetical protein